MVIENSTTSGTASPLSSIFARTECEHLDLQSIYHLASVTLNLDFICSLALLLPPANEVWGKVIFSEACVKNSVHGGGGGCLVCSRGVSALGVSAPGGICSGGVCSRGSLLPGGLLPGGLLLGGVSAPGGCLLSGGCAWWRPPGMTTAAGGTHPTGMHSCETILLGQTLQSRPKDENTGPIFDHLIAPVVCAQRVEKVR